jgi:hypothetical protein
MKHPNKETIKIRLDMLAGSVRGAQFCHPEMMNAIGFIGGLEFAGVISQEEGDAFLERLHKERAATCGN